MNTKSRKSYVLMSAKAYGVRRTKGSPADFLKTLGQAMSAAMQIQRKLKAGGDAPTLSVVSKAEFYNISKMIRGLIMLLDLLPGERSNSNTPQLMISATLRRLNRDILELVSSVEGEGLSAKRAARYFDAPDILATVRRDVQRIMSNRQH